MKNVFFLIISLLFISCGKNAVYKPVQTNSPTNTGTGTGVNVGTSYTFLNDSNLVASITYDSNKLVSSRQEAQYNVPVSGIVQIPQLVTVNQGWAGKFNSVTITLEMIGSGSITCTYTSIATTTHKSTQTASEGVKYLFTACSDNTVSPLTYVEEVNSVSLKIDSADDLITQTTVMGTMKIFQ